MLLGHASAPGSDDEEDDDDDALDERRRRQEEPEHEAESGTPRPRRQRHVADAESTGEREGNERDHRTTRVPAKRSCSNRDGRG